MPYFFPHSLLNLDAFSLFGMIVLICLVSGELISRITIFPRISGYIALGYLLGPNFLGIINFSLLADMQGIIDISLGLIAFSVGRHLDFSWLKNDIGLLYTGVTGFLLTTTLVSAFIALQGWDILLSLFAGVIASTSSPAVILMVARDLYSEGPVTRRSLTLTSINNLLALVSLAVLLPFTESGKHTDWILIAHSMYRVIGSLLLGILFFKLLELIAHRVIGKQRELQLLLLISIIVLAITFGKFFNCSSILVLLSIGVSSRNFDFNRALMEIDFGWLSHLFFIPMFFVTGCYFSFSGILQEPVIVIIFLLIRLFSQLGSNLIFAKKSLLTYKQSLAISIALTPMTGIAVGITSKVLDYTPEIGQSLLLIISPAIGILGLFGPILTQIAFYKSGEALKVLRKVGSNE